jgi:hypothetical protein
MSALIEVLEVALADLDPEQLRGAIDSPQSGAKRDRYALDVQGWAVGGRAAAAAIEFGQGGGKPWPNGGIPPWRVPLDIGRPDIASSDPEEGTDVRGFHSALNMLRLEREFELSVDVVLEDETRVRLADIRGRRSRLHSGFEPRIQPISLTTLGRTGTTMLTKMLGTHPEILTYRAFQYEPAAAGYWLHVLRSLAEPASYIPQVAPPLARNEGWWLAPEPPTRYRGIDDPGVENWIGAAGVEAAAAFCQSRIEALYEELARHLGRGRPAYFAEKHGPGWVSTFLPELYPRAREIFVVRDFRDIVCSILAFNAKRGRQLFGRQHVETDAEFIDWMGQHASRLVDAWERRGSRGYLLRYEDLVLRPSETLEGVLEYLALDSSEATIETMLESVSGGDPDMDWHRTSKNAQESVGRWQRELDPGLQQACELAFGAALETFGYELESPVGAD